MGGVASDEFCELLLVAPAGAALLARLEADERPDAVGLWRGPADVDRAAVVAAAGRAAEREVEELIALAVTAAHDIAGSWSNDAPAQVAVALRLAPRRLELAKAVVERLSTVLDAPLDRECQEWWWSDTPLPEPPRFARLGEPDRRPCGAWVTSTWDGVWTVTAPGDALADPLVST